MQPPKVQESILEQLATFLASKSLDRDPGRKAAITVNVAVAILGSLKLVMNDQIPSASLNTPSVLKIVQEILHVSGTRSLIHFFRLIIFRTSFYILIPLCGM